MTRTILSYLSILLMAVVTASADQLDFSDLQIGEEVLGYYNGGFGSLGTGPGPNLGVTFTADFVTVATGLPFQAEELTSASGIMDVLHGFNGTLSFYYTNSGPDDGAVNLYSGLDGSGSLLGTIALFAQATPDFTPVGAGGAIEFLPFESAIFTGTPGALMFHNITFGPPGSPPVLPEPSSIRLLLIGLLAVWLTARKSIAGLHWSGR